MDEPLAQNDEFLKLVERNKQIIEELKQLNIEKDELAQRANDIKLRALALLDESRALVIQLKFYTEDGHPQ
jgi:hypothetical protein